MTRTCYLVFFGEFRGHGHPHESPPTMRIPLVILAGLSCVVGLLNAPGIEKFNEWVVFEVPGVPEFLHHHAFNPGIAAISLAVAALGIGVAAGYYLRHAFPYGMVQKNGLARTGYKVLVNKYYLDELFVNGIIRKIQYPIAKAAYWVNQNVIDGVVNAAGTGSRKVANFVYDNIDQKVVDGLVNGAGAGAEAGGSELRRTQNGRVQSYAAYLFGAAALLAVGLVAFT